MTTTLTELATTLQTVFTTDAEQAARDAGLIRRARQFTGATFVQTLVFGWLDNPQATHEDLAEVAADLGIDITPDALGRRLGSAACDCLQEVLRQALHHVIAAQPAALPLLRRFAGVYVQDASTVGLPAGLADLLPGCGGGTAPGQGAAAVKLLPRLELTTGALEAIALLPGKASERADELAWAPLPAGALLLEDLGFFDLGRLRHYHEQGAYFLSRLPSRIALWDGQGHKSLLAEFLRRQTAPALDAEVEVGAEARLRVRLLAERVPEAVARKRQERLRRRASKKGRKVSADSLELCRWDVLVTNVPGWLLSAREAQVLRRVRWQVELVFKVWKSEGGLDESRGRKPYRVLCEVLAKLLAMVVQHWASLVAGGSPLLSSQRKAARRVRKVALRLLRVLASVRRLAAVLERLRRRVQRYGRVRPRKGSTQPATFQTLLNPQHDGLHKVDPG
jgi:hypothetical protein